MMNNYLNWYRNFDAKYYCSVKWNSIHHYKYTEQNLPHLACTSQILTILEFKVFENSKVCAKIYDKNENGK